MRIRLTISLLIASVLVISQVNGQKKYKYSVDLNEIKNDRLTINLATPAMSKDSILFHMPKMVPGTYAIENYGSYLKNFKAYDKAGNELNVTRKDKNSWMIYSAKKLYKLQYEVDDTWDSPEIKEEIFEPAGTNIQKDSLFVLNTFGFFGYFEGMELLKYELRVRRPATMYGATSLDRIGSRESNTDVFFAANYHLLADAPIMYAKPDTSYLKVGRTKVLVAVHSPNNKISAKEVANELLPLLRVQEKYLNGKMPVKKYAFLIHLTDNKNITRFGALEHSYSSMYYLPETMDSVQLANTIKDVAAHEFFHIITPLNVHSEQIGNFNYIEPEMSRHLWMYEGLTEYAAHHAQVRGGIINWEEFLQRLKGKIKTSTSLFNDTLPFTELSKEALGKHKEQYQNVYEKGALIGLCLDISLRSLSDGKYSTQQLMGDLSKRFGRDKSFQDDELFDIITSMTYPEIGSFLQTYVAGKKPLPLDSIFRLAGINFQPSDTVYAPEIDFGTGVNFGLVPTGDTLYVANLSKPSNLMKRIGVNSGDKILELNGKSFLLSNYKLAIEAYGEEAKVGSTISLKVLRKNKEGSNQWEEKLLSATIRNESKVEATLKPDLNATTKQKALLENWLSKN